MSEEQVLMDVVFCVDATGSMGSTIQAAKEKCISIAQSVREENKDTDIMLINNIRAKSVAL